MIFLISLLEIQKSLNKLRLTLVFINGKLCIMSMALIPREPPLSDESHRGLSK